MNETRTLVKWLASTRYGDLPSEVIHSAKLRILDTLGVALYGSKTDWVKMAAEMAKEAGCAQESSVWGYGFKTSAQHAALVNGTMGHGFELDDIYKKGGQHPGAVVIPAALAVAEKFGASAEGGGANGQSFLAGVVLGYEAMGRVGRSLIHQIMRGFHPTGCNGPFGAVAAAGAIMNLSEKDLLNAFGIAGSLASGLSEFSQDPEGTMVKRLHGGRPAEGGVMAAFLAAKGFTGPSTVLEGKYGYIRVYAGIEESRPEEITRDLGKDWCIMDIQVKPYACCGAIHSTIDAISQLKREYGITPDRVEKVTVSVGAKVFSQNNQRNPQSMMSAQYSLPFTAALALREDVRNPSAFSDGAIRDKSLRAIMEKIELVEDKELTDIAYETYGAKLTVKLAGGKEAKATVLYSKGMSQNPMTDEELREKYRILAGTTLAKDKVAEIEKMVDRLEQTSNIRILADLLRG